MANHLREFFPSPKFLKPRHIGISFSDFDIKGISIRGSKSHPDLENLAIPLEHGVIVDGKIVNEAEVIKKLSILKETLTSPFVFFTIPDDLTYLFTVTLPVSKETDAGESVAFTIEENVPLSLPEAVFDYMPVSVFRADSGYNSEIVVTVSVKKEVEKFIECITNSGLEAVGCIHESQAVVNAVVPKDIKEVTAVINVRSDRVGIYLAKNGIVHFATLRNILPGDYKKQFLDEYEKFLDYSVKYSSAKEDSIKTIYVCGEFEFTKKAIESILESSTVAKDAKLSNVWVNVLKIEKELPKISYEESLNLASPVGAALADIM